MISYIPESNYQVSEKVWYPVVRNVITKFRTNSMISYSPESNYQVSDKQYDIL